LWNKEVVMAASWDKVEVAVEMAKGIGFDQCHKIYVLMDDEQMAQMKEWGYDPLLSADDLTPSEMLATIQDWYADSCGLRFVQAVRTVGGDPNEGFISLIEQGADDEDENE
jgi:hypothetical protein